MSLNTAKKPHASEAVLFSSKDKIELPTCPVCLERIDTTETGILTSICNHTFHCSCLAKWRSDTGCPVCRYCLENESDTKNTCFECGKNTQLWICLICGHIGCGRYEDGHAFDHFKQSQHTFSLELETQRVWDYIGDGYVHRLIQNKTDGKLVELNPRTGTACGQSSDNEKLNERKIDSILTEYNFLLSSQLECQRNFYESQIDEIQSKLTDLSSQLDKEQEKRSHVESKFHNVNKDRTQLNAKLKSSLQRSEKLQKEIEFLQQVNASMTQSQNQWKEKLMQAERKRIEQLVEKERTIIDLKEQVRDLSFFIEAQRKLEATSDHDKQALKDGVISISNVPKPQPKQRGRRRRGRKR